MISKKFVIVIFLFSFISLAQEKKYDPQITQANYSLLDWSKAYTAEIDIRKPLREVWSYASNSGNAVDWSVYFHHISPLPGPIEDGKVGSLRRCYRYENEKGVFWDEEVLSIAPEQSRLILSFNFKGYYRENISYTTYVLQSYIKIDDRTTRLRFQTMPTAAMTLVDRFIYYFSKKQVEDIFKMNLENIKNQIESNSRIHKHDSVNYRFFEKQ